MAAQRRAHGLVWKFLGKGILLLWSSGVLLCQASRAWRVRESRPVFLAHAAARATQRSQKLSVSLPSRSLCRRAASKPGIYATSSSSPGVSILSSRQSSVVREQPGSHVPSPAITRPCSEPQRQALSEGSELHACRSTLSPVSCSRIACPSLLFILLPLPALPFTARAASSLRSRSCRRGEGDSSFITL